ncbi:hypothetical protein DPMN_141627 [Dreissena polymorpha]|uniref:Uncharacterized protein n=1 Tax=Dreissena polymorpha TaxID=45954 RepID=A0A9D4G9T8_DREPO|nr:hypothetical protein DPMN_141627 [Dreissena polymorpha]
MGAPAKHPLPLNSRGRFDGSPVGGLTGDPVKLPFSMSLNRGFKGASRPKNTRGSLMRLPI